MTADIFQSESVDQTMAIARALARRLAVGDCVALDGQLGAGKTQFTRGLAAGLGLANPAMVSSPTFVLMQEYPARMPVYHLDAYRLGDAEAELADMGFDEMLADGVVVLEWSDRAEAILPPKSTWRVHIEVTGENTRRIHVMPPR